MKKSELLCLVLAFMLYGSLWTTTSYAQLQPTSNISSKMTSGNASSLVSVKATVALQISNETVKTQQGMLVGAVINFLSSGPTVLKTSTDDQTIVKTKIVNDINKATQNVEGTEATNAILPVEIDKALKSISSSFNQPNQTSPITVETSSTCTPSNSKLTSCDNVVTIK